MDYQSFFSILYFIDGVTIIDTSGTIIFSMNFSPQRYSGICDTEEVLGKRLSEVFPNIARENSTLFRAMEQGVPVFKERQSITTSRGDHFETMNVSIPIRINNRIVGAVELSRYLGPEKDTGTTDITLSEELIGKLPAEQPQLGCDRARYELTDIISINPAMQALKENAARFSGSASPVFICGETGTGKELFAQALHNAGPRRDKPFIAQNCAAIPDTLLESILFGTARGGFTGAVDSPGLFETADGGTLFLDEIDSMPLHLQTKLLRVLQDHRVRRLGGYREKAVDVRIISAAGDKPEECVRKKRIRRDLFYRLCVLTLHIPPLRERKEDLEPLLRYFIAGYNRTLGTSIKAISRNILDAFSRYPWPGNVRELEHLVEYALHMVEPGEKTLRMEHLSGRFGVLEEPTDGRDVSAPPVDLKEYLGRVERDLLFRALETSSWNYTRAAALLGISRQTLQNRARRYNFQED
ncbi:MAG: sigma 54-interacting transcriptional regulator [Spirochaetales bacterium]|nr:sigma 54-interacting transcriptional regulator [Spirochaetales bacterium]